MLLLLRTYRIASILCLMVMLHTTRGFLKNLWQQHLFQRSTTSLSTRASSSEILKREFEHKLVETGFKYIIGVDEAGRGPIAGPVVAAALVCLPTHTNLLAAADSKVLSEKRREEIYSLVQNDPTILYAHSVISESVIDEINILQATMMAMHESVETLLTQSTEMLNHLDACYALVDGNKSPKFRIKNKPVVRGDALVYPIALASIVAKVERDALMRELDRLHPEYGFAKHKGYPTKEHILALHKYGPIKAHRYCN